MLLTPKLNFSMIYDTFSFITFVERSVRYSLIGVAFNIILCDFLGISLKEYYRRLKQSKPRKRNTLKKLVFYHVLYVHSIKRFTSVNKVAIKRFYTFAVTMHLLSNVNLMAAMLIQKLQIPSKILFGFISVSQIVLIYITVHFLLMASNSLTKPSKLILNHMNYLFRKNKLSSKLYIRLATHFEMYSSKKQFKFQLGTVGNIHRKNVFFFIFFYSSNFMFIYEHMRKTKLRM